MSDYLTPNQKGHQILPTLLRLGFVQSVFLHSLSQYKVSTNEDLKPAVECWPWKPMAMTLISVGFQPTTRIPTSHDHCASLGQLDLGKHGNMAEAVSGMG